LTEIAPVPRSRTLADRTYRHVKNLILTNALRPGQTVTETWLAETLAVSRTPIRHAISRLSSEGLVVVDRGRIQIRQILLDEARHLAEFRLAVEGSVARALAHDGMPENGFVKLEQLSAELATLVGEQGECDDFGQFMGINRSFHLELARQSSNPMIIDAVSRAHDLLTITRQTLSEIPGRPGAILEEHAAILTAIRERDAAAAEAAVARHILAPLDAKGQEETKRQAAAGTISA
jgi:DNA-binding GntR family transcriptional regulator